MDKFLKTGPRILFLFSDTGGGHRSATEAIIEALQLEVGDQVVTEMVDIFKEYSPRPLNRIPDLYPQLVRVPQAWGLGYRLSNGQQPGAPDHSQRLAVCAPVHPQSSQSASQRFDSFLCTRWRPRPVLRALGGKPARRLLSLW